MNQPHIKCKGSPRETSKQIRIKAKWASSPQLDAHVCGENLQTATQVGCERVHRRTGHVCVPRSTGVYRTDTGVCFLHLQKSKGRRLTDAAHAVGFGGRSCVTWVVSGDPHKGDLATAVLKGPHWRRLSANKCKGKAIPAPQGCAVRRLFLRVTAGRSQWGSGRSSWGSWRTHTMLLTES